MLRILSSMSLIVAVVVAVSGCNTVAGVGKDMKAGGQAIENAADKSKSK
jgi:entericidin B